MTLAKICGITNVEDAVAAVRYGANFIGLVFAKSPRQVDMPTAKHLLRVVGADVKTVGVFTEESDDMLRIIDELGLTYAQLHGYQSEEFARRIGSERVIRVIRIRDEDSILELDRYEHAAFYLLDTYRPDQLGGTGRVFDWNLAVQAKRYGKGLFLSGGLGPENVAEAISMVRPYAVDASSGLEESPGKKDHGKMQEFLKNVRRADGVAR